ncbi:MAG TPA: hypothetical protein VHU80_05070 [Polyangiaceae bacterium]|jgi:hypothetical protein|nr:hypothetical protein [Polyangiaceae bacterium]
MPPDARVLVPTPLVPERATAVRGTVLMASQEALKKGGYFDRYASNVDDAYRKKLLDEIVPNTWLGIDQAMAHYRACEALGLDAAVIHEMGTAVGDRINSVFVKSLIHLASGTVQPWFAWQLAPRVWARAWKGSAVGVRKMGPTEARVDVVGFPCASISYVRVSLAAFFAKNTQLFCRTAVARQVRSSSDSPESVSYAVSWL